MPNKNVNREENLESESIDELEQSENSGKELEKNNGEQGTRKAKELEEVSTQQSSEMDADEEDLDQELEESALDEDKDEDEEKKKDGEKQFGHLEFAELPLYPQVSNGCGLATLLMNINPIKNRADAKFLEAAYEQVRQMIPYSSKIPTEAFQWAYTLQYLLMKCTTPNAHSFLADYLNEALSYTIEDQIFLYQANMQGFLARMIKDGKPYFSIPIEAYLNEGLLNYLLLEKELKQMKTDIELKILMEIFGYSFEFQQTDDPFGAIKFEEEELAEPTETTFEKIKLLDSLLKNPDYRFFFGIAHHWVALTAIINTKPNSSKFRAKNYVLRFNDPNSVEKAAINFKRLSGACRIYAFKKNTRDYGKLQQELLKAITADIEKEKGLLADVRLAMLDHMQAKAEEEAAKIKEESKPLPSIAEPQKKLINIKEKTGAPVPSGKRPLKSKSTDSVGKKFVPLGKKSKQEKTEHDIKTGELEQRVATAHGQAPAKAETKSEAEQRREKLRAIIRKNLYKP